MLLDVEDESNCYLILGNHYWAVLAWKLAEISFDGRVRIFRLGEQGCEFEFVYNLSAWRAIPRSIKWFDRGEGIVIQKVGGAEAVMKNCLRFSNNITYNDLVQLAIDCGIDRPKGKSRVDLLTALATQLGDEDFAGLVVAQDTKASKGAISSSALIQCLYENLDSDEKRDFESMKEAADRSQKALTQKKWQKHLKERTDEINATQSAFNL